MSTTQPLDQFLTKNLFKKMIGSTDTQDDDSYIQFVVDGNSKVQTAISRYIDTPIGQGSAFWSRCRNAALSFARSLHAEDIELIEKSKHYMEKYNIELYGEKGTEARPMAGGLIQEIISTRTTRSKSVLAANDPRDEKVTLTTQTDIFVSEDFG